MAAALMAERISFHQREDFYLSRIPLLCNLIPLNVGPHSGFDYWRSVGEVGAD